MLPLSYAVPHNTTANYKRQISVEGIKFGPFLLPAMEVELGAQACVLEFGKSGNSELRKY